MILKNLKEGNTTLKLIWHAEKMNVDSVIDSHVWFLSTIAEMPNGEKKLFIELGLLEKHPVKKTVGRNLNLKGNGVEKVWVTRKYPLLVFLWPAIVPLFLVGGPMAYIMPLLGILHQVPLRSTFFGRNPIHTYGRMLHALHCEHCTSCKSSREANVPLLQGIEP